MASAIKISVASFFAVMLSVALLPSETANTAPANGVLVVGDTGASVTHEWSTIDFGGVFDFTPLFFAGTQTYNGSDPVALRYRNLGVDNVEVFLEEEQSKDKEVAHAPENVGYVAMEGPGYISDQSDNIIGEAGWATFHQPNKKSWYTIGLRGSYTNPVVLALVPSYNGGNPSTMRLRKVTPSSFQVQLDEWQYLDGAHIQEDVDYLVMEKGVHTLLDGTVVEVGKISGNHIFKNVALVHDFDDEPVVLAQSQTYKGGAAIVARLQNVTADAFDVRLQEEQKQDDIHATETIGYAAFTYVNETDPPVDDQGELSVVGQTIASTASTVENARNKLAYRLEATASDAQDLLITRLEFEARTGSLLNGETYDLWADNDGDGEVDLIVEDDVVAQDGVVSFTDMLPDVVPGGRAVLAGETVVFEVHFDVANSLTSDRLQLKFATSEPHYVEAEHLDDGSDRGGIETDGVCEEDVCRISVTTTPNATLWSLFPHGDLFVTEDTTPIRSRQLLGGELSEPVLGLTLTAEKEPIDVTDIQILSLTGAVASIDRLELYLEGEASPFALATIGGCGSDIVPVAGATYCANMESEQLIVPVGEDIDVLVRARIKSDVNGGISQESILLGIDSTPVATFEEGAVRARGKDSSNSLLANDEDALAEGEIFIGTNIPAPNADIEGSKHVTVMAKITAITNANPDPNGTAVPIGISPFGQLKFTAAAHSNSNNGLNDVIFDRLVFTVNATNVLIEEGSLRLYNKADAVTTRACQAYDLSGVAITGDYTGVFYADCDFLAETDVNTEIDNGSAETLVLEANILNPVIDGAAVSTLQMSFTTFDSIDYQFAGPFPGYSHVSWLDADGGSSTQFFWIDYPETAVSSTAYQS